MLLLPLLLLLLFVFFCTTSISTSPIGRDVSFFSVRCAGEGVDTTTACPSPASSFVFFCIHNIE